MALPGNGTTRPPTPEPRPATTLRNAPAATDCPATGSPDPERTSHPRHQHQHPAELPPEDPSEEPLRLLSEIPEDEQLGSDDFLPHLDMRAVSVSVEPDSEAYDADPEGATEGPAGETSGCVQLTSVALAALPGTRAFNIHSWIESVENDNMCDAEGIDIRADDGAPIRVDIGGLVAMGGWCPVEATGYPAVLRAEDVSTDEGMSGWVDVTRDEG